MLFDRCVGLCRRSPSERLQPKRRPRARPRLNRRRRRARNREQMTAIVTMTTEATAVLAMRVVALARPVAVVTRLSVSAEISPLFDGFSDFAVGGFPVGASNSGPTFSFAASTGSSAGFTFGGQPGAAQLDSV